MILFISPYPEKEKERDGMRQRVFAIDRIFGDQERHYINMRYIGNFIPRAEKKSGLTTFYHLNFFIHFFYILYLVRKAKFVYVHSVYMALKTLPLYYICSKIITDMHGLVPEELAVEGKGNWSRIYNWVEGVAVRKSKLIVTVSGNMVRHFSEKHGRPAGYCNLPIFSAGPAISERLNREGGKLRVIYAGGTHKWQNVGMMVNAMKSTIDIYDFTVLTGDFTFFRDKLREQGIYDRVELNSVPHDEIYKYYSRADLGFVLRDDTIINNVACPTKLIEYLASGVIPIVIKPNIGDFGRYNYRYVLLSDFLKGVFLPEAERKEMIAQNAVALEKIKEEAEQSIKKLQLMTGY